MGADKIQAGVRMINLLSTALSQVSEESFVTIFTPRALFQRKYRVGSKFLFTRLPANIFPNNCPKIFRRWNPAPSYLSAI